ncbi:MAG: hypothetical protein ACLT2T_06835 [Bilophila wadsworthia]
MPKPIRTWPRSSSACTCAVDLMKNTPPKQFVEEYQKFYLEFVGKEYNYNQACSTGTHPLSNIDEQLAILTTQGPSQAAHQSDIAAFFSGVGRITADEAAKVAEQVCDRQVPEALEGQRSVGEYREILGRGGPFWVLPSKPHSLSQDFCVYRILVRGLASARVAFAVRRITQWKALSGESGPAVPCPS